jgi:hypothetical protein
MYTDSVHWIVDGKSRRVVYFVARFPFVPDYHLCDFVEDGQIITERPMQHFKTLSEALSVLRVIEGSRT